MWQIFWAEQVFPWSDWAHIEQAPSSNRVLTLCLRISWSVKYFYQKYWVKASKSCTSAGTPRINRRPIQWWRWGRVLRTIFFIWKSSFFVSNCCFFDLEMVPGWSGIVLKKPQIFKNQQKISILCDRFSEQNRSSRGPIELILSKRQALIEFWRFV